MPHPPARTRSCNTYSSFCSPQDPPSASKTSQFSLANFSMVSAKSSFSKNHFSTSYIAYVGIAEDHRMQNSSPKISIIYFDVAVHKDLDDIFWRCCAKKNTCKIVSFPMSTDLTELTPSSANFLSKFWELPQIFLYPRFFKPVEIRKIWVAKTIDEFFVLIIFSRIFFSIK